MTPAQILAALRSPDSEHHEAAVLAAMDAPQAVIPGLLAILEEALADPLAFMEDPDHSAHIVALFLLAQFREPRTLPPLLAMLRLSEEEQDVLLGDFLTESLASILASLCEGDPRPLEELAADQELDIYVRNAAMDALLALGFQGTLSGERLRELFDSLLATFEQRGRAEDSLAWANLASSCALAGFTSLLPRLRAAFDAGLVEADLIGPEELEAAMTRNQAHYHRRFLKDHHTVEDALLELEDRSWLLGAEDEDLDELDDLDEADEAFIPTLGLDTLHRVIARQGRPLSDPPQPSRNAPCPCGSGKKYKRCCGK